MEIEVSVIIPCLNEEETIGLCIRKASECFKKNNICGEIIVVDNGSTDSSIEKAKSEGAHIIFEKNRGYGSALRTGIESAHGKYIVMGDGDNTYDFLEIHKFVDLLRRGYNLVIGSRFKGKILPGAMSWSHRYIGNPILSKMLNLFFHGKISDAHCGLRAFTKGAYQRMNLRTTGMEFASEMVIHGLKKNLRIGEIPITYYSREGQSKLSSFRDAWRHIRFMLLYSPNYLFLFPACLIFLFGIILLVRLLFGPILLFGRFWDIHVMVFSSIITILGWQILNLGLCAKMYAHHIGLELTSLTQKIVKMFSLERALLLGGIISLIGLGFSLYVFIVWAKAGFGRLAQVKTGIVSLTLIAMGVGMIFSSFLVSMLEIKYLQE